jgi:hypothetical protein
MENVKLYELPARMVEAPVVVSVLGSPEAGRIALAIEGAPGFTQKVTGLLLTVGTPFTSGVKDTAVPKPFTTFNAVKNREYAPGEARVTEAKVTV